jgi:hypothetical protein
MQIIEYPTFRNIKEFAISDIYVVGNDTSVNQYCTEYGYTLVSYSIEDQRFSNNGSFTYQYLTSGGTWLLETGFRRVVSELIVN